MMNSKRSGLLLIVSLVLVLVGLGIFTAVRDSGDEEVVTDGNWETYVNDEFDFSIDHPEGWNVTVSPEEQIEPIITISQESESESGAMPPYDHFMNATYVSVFPQGLGTEGLLGQSEDTDIDFEVGLEEGIDYMLEDGTVFATFANLQDVPDSWSPAGYVFGRAHIENLETQCERDGEEIQAVACDIPMEEGAEIVWYGEISEGERETVEAMLESFRFVEDEAAQDEAE